jgi:hypothetical protein
MKQSALPPVHISGQKIAPELTALTAVPQTLFKL